MKYELIYHSVANENNTSQDIKDILKEAREFNLSKNITGCLLAYNNEFLQILEGEKVEVLSLYKNIVKDKRHIGPIILHQGEIQERVFPTWTMAYHEITDSELTQVKDVMNISEFEGFLTTMQKPTLAKKLFVSISKSMIQLVQ